MLSFERLRRAPDAEGSGLAASDAADRLILDESHAERARVAAGEIAVIGDTHGALTLASITDGATDVRVHQDALTGERALANNARELDLDGFRSLPLDAAVVRDARVVLVRLPRSLDALRDIARLIAAHAHPKVTVFAGGRIKHMTTTMNAVLAGSFGTVDVTHARQKSRVLIARHPLAAGAGDPVPAAAREAGIEIRAFAGAFAGARIDHGTRMLLAHLPAHVPVDAPLVDFACGTGVVAAHWALQHPDARVYASDQSAAAVASARATAMANGVADRVRVVRDDLLQSLGDQSARVIALNPPFHSGGAVTDQLAPRMFADAARVLRSGGQLWCVWNSGLQYRSSLQRIVGPTEQVARDARFTVTVSTKR